MRPLNENKTTLVFEKLFKFVGPIDLVKLIKFVAMRPLEKNETRKINCLISLVILRFS